MPIDPVASAVEAVATFLDTALDGVVSKVIRGWPESAEGLDLSGLPVVSITPPSQGNRTPCPAKSLGSTTDEEGVVTHTYRVGWLDFQIQIDLWCAYRAQMDDVGALIEAACIQDPPLPPHIRVTSTDYHSRPLTCTLGNSASDYDGDVSHKGEWRMSWDLDVSTDTVRTVTHVPLSQLEIEVATSGTGDTITETSIVFEP